MVLEMSKSSSCSVDAAEKKSPAAPRLELASSPVSWSSLLEMEISTILVLFLLDKPLDLFRLCFPWAE